MQRRGLPNVGRACALAALASSAGWVAEGQQVPRFEVDALWPMPLEYPSILGPVSGVTVAPDGNVLIVTRQDGFNGTNETNVLNNSGDCCRPSLAVLEFRPDGSLVREWGGPDLGYPWPARPHGIAIDPAGNIWIGGGMPPAAGGGGRGGAGGGRGGAGGGAAAPAAPAAPPPGPQADGFILKFSRTGQHLATFGQAGLAPASSTGMTSFGGANGFAFDAAANEAFVADGYLNRRVAVVDIATGRIKRVWGAYGAAPSDEPLPPYSATGAPARQFRNVTCVARANDGRVYVCDQGNNRIQVFESNGTYVSELVIAPQTLGNGSVTDIAFSPDQRFLYVADGSNERVHIVERATMTVRTTFGTGGRYPSHFRELGGVAVDAAGNIYTSENGQGRRVQKFVNTGMGPVTAQHQGAVYPAAGR